MYFFSLHRLLESCLHDGHNCINENKNHLKQVGKKKCQPVFCFYEFDYNIYYASDAIICPTIHFKEVERGNIRVNKINVHMGVLQPHNIRRKNQLWN